MWSTLFCDHSCLSCSLIPTMLLLVNGFPVCIHQFLLYISGSFLLMWPQTWLFIPVPAFSMGASQVVLVVKNLPANAGDTRGFNPWVGKIPWRRKSQPTPVFLPGKSHGRSSLVGYSPWGRKESDMTEQVYFHFTKGEESWCVIGSLLCSGPGYWTLDMLPILSVLHSTCVRQIILQPLNRWGKYSSE